MKYTDLERHISSIVSGTESAKSAYIIGGSDAYLRASAMNMFKGLVDKEYADFNLSIVAQADGVSAVLDALALYPVFDERKVVVVPDVNSKLTDGDKELIKTYFLSPNPTSILVAVCDDVPAKEFATKNGIEYVNCDKLDENEIAFEIDKLLAVEPSRTIDKNAIHSLVVKTQSDMSRIVCEIKKLKAYCDNKITTKDVDDMVAPDLDFAVFELTGAVSEKQADRALEILDVFSKQGVKGMAIITMLYNQYRKMLFATLYKGDDESLATLLETNTRALYHVKRIAKNYSQVRLKKSVDYLHSLQYAIVSGKRMEDTAVHEALLTLLNM